MVKYISREILWFRGKRYHRKVQELFGESSIDSFSQENIQVQNPVKITMNIQSF
uniref:Uncharacterized protein n=1 Tax=Rhizophagus irregularis (strain DAOM 181602 / DAOM 197198 / MUCL 43194) TaxID=747089 RepID=U9TKB5_RHIID